MKFIYFAAILFATLQLSMAHLTEEKRKFLLSQHHITEQSLHEEHHFTPELKAPMPDTGLNIHDGISVTEVVVASAGSLFAVIFLGYLYQRCTKKGGLYSAESSIRAEEKDNFLNPSKNGAAILF